MSKEEQQFRAMSNCSEIQDRWEPKVGDWTDEGIIVGTAYKDNIVTSKPTSFNCYTSKYGATRWLPRKKLIYLPTERDLQAMVETVKRKLHRMFRFHNFICTAYTPITRHTAFTYFINLLNTTKPERALWLAFVLWEPHEKKWDGKKWK